MQQTLYIVHCSLAITFAFPSLNTITVRTTEQAKWKQANWKSASSSSFFLWNMPFLFRLRRWLVGFWVIFQIKQMVILSLYENIISILLIGAAVVINNNTVTKKSSWLLVKVKISKNFVKSRREFEDISK